MALTEVRASVETQEKLGSQALEDLRRTLFAVDCQRCGGPMRAQTPAVSVEEIGSFAQASVHHADCGEPRWFSPEVFVISPNETPMITYRTYSVLATQPLIRSEGANLPIILVNPSLEVTYLYRRGSGWRVDPMRQYRKDNGMTRGSLSARLNTVNDSALTVTAVGENGDLRLTLRVGGGIGWDVGMSQPIAGATLRAGGTVVVITASVDPHVVADPSFGISDLRKLIESADTVIGWVPLTQGVTRPQHEGHQR